MFWDQYCEDHPEYVAAEESKPPAPSPQQTEAAEETEADPEGAANRSRLVGRLQAITAKCILADPGMALAADGVTENEDPAEVLGAIIGMMDVYCPELVEDLIDTMGELHTE